MRIGFISGSTDVGCFYILGGDNKLHKVDVGSDGMFSFDIEDSPIRANSQLQLIREETILDPKAFVGGCEGESVCADDGAAELLSRKGAITIRKYLVKNQWFVLTEITYQKGELPRQN
jgi:hypothetical protein